MKGLIEAIEKENLKDSVPAFNVGDTVKVSVKVVEGGLLYTSIWTARRTMCIRKFRANGN